MIRTSVLMFVLCAMSASFLGYCRVVVGAYGMDNINPVVNAPWGDNMAAREVRANHEAGSCDSGGMITMAPVASPDTKGNGEDLLRLESLPDQS
jgi:hypothetical protein